MQVPGIRAKQKPESLSPDRGKEFVEERGHIVIFKVTTVTFKMSIIHSLAILCNLR
jgi:hypothetical protein